MSIKHTITASLMMVLTSFILGYLSHPEETHLNRPFSMFPMKVGEWNGKTEQIAAEVMPVLGVDDYLMCNYINPQGKQIQLYIGFYESQREGDLIHSPKNCMPGAGWNITETSLESLANIAGSPDIIKLSLINSFQQKQLVLYWFQGRGRIISSEYLQKIYLVIDSITRQRTDEAFIRVITPVVAGNEQDSLNLVKGFIKQIMPIINEYLPS